MSALLVCGCMRVTHELLLDCALQTGRLCRAHSDAEEVRAGDYMQGDQKVCGKRIHMIHPLLASHMRACTSAILRATDASDHASRCAAGTGSWGSNGRGFQYSS